MDEKAIGIQGHSWGGYQIAYMVTQTNRFKAASAGAPVSNMTSAYGGIRWGTRPAAAVPVREDAEPHRRDARGRPRCGIIENSPVFMADRVKTPLLMLHNDQDDAVPWYQGIEYYLALRRLGKEVYLLNYNGELHGLRNEGDQRGLHGADAAVLRPPPEGQRRRRSGWRRACRSSSGTRRRSSGRSCSSPRRSDKSATRPRAHGAGSPWACRHFIAEDPPCPARLIACRSACSSLALPARRARTAANRRREDRLQGHVAPRRRDRVLRAAGEAVAARPADRLRHQPRGPQAAAARLSRPAGRHPGGGGRGRGSWSCWRSPTSTPARWTARRRCSRWPATSPPRRTPAAQGPRGPARPELERRTATRRSTRRTAPAQNGPPDGVGTRANAQGLRPEPRLRQAGNAPRSAAWCGSFNEWDPAARHRLPHDQRQLPPLHADLRRPALPGRRPAARRVAPSDKLLPGRRRSG